YLLTPAKPTVDMEPAYENHPTGDNKPRIDAHKVRSQAYSAILAIHMDKLNRSQVKAQWYDPRDGTWKAIGQYPNKGTALSIGKPNAHIDFTSTNKPRTDPYL